MPIVDIEIVADRKLAPGLATRLAYALAPIFGGPANGTWVKVRHLEVGDYAEGDGGPSGEVRPVFVTILKADPPAGEELAEEAGKVIEAVAAACEHPVENVHVIYESAGRGRVAFGGNLID